MMKEVNANLWHHLLNFFDLGPFFAKNDLKTAGVISCILDIFLQHLFHLVNGRKEPSYSMFTVLPFSLTSATCILTKLLRAIVKL